MTTKPPVRRRIVLSVVFALLGAPVLLALVEAVSFNVANRNNGTIISSGREREYLIHVPKSYDRSKATPLVISMHGGAMWPASQRDVSRWNRVADRHGFLVVYPSGMGLSRHKVWSAGQEGTSLRDVQFISDLIDALKAEYNIDSTRIYADGLSNGAGMAFRLSCELPDRIAAIGMVASAVFLSWEHCPAHRQAPTIVVHGTADSFAHYHGGTSWVARNQTFPDIPLWTATKAERSGCGPRPTLSRVAADVTRTTYTGCADGAAVELYTIHGGGHTWPGGEAMAEWFVGTTSRSMDASSVMWEFFNAHPLRPQGEVNEKPGKV